MAVEKSTFNNGDHMLILVTAKIIHFSVSECKKLILKDGQLLHMVKIVGAVRIVSVNIKNVIIDVEDGTGFVQDGRALVNSQM